MVGSFWVFCIFLGFGFFEVTFFGFWFLFGFLSAFRFLGGSLVSLGDSFSSLSFVGFLDLALWFVLALFLVLAGASRFLLAPSYSLFGFGSLFLVPSFFSSPPGCCEEAMEEIRFYLRLPPSRPHMPPLFGPFVPFGSPSAGEHGPGQSSNWLELELKAQVFRALELAS
ncbi:hypothetical protein DFP73DRAFT_560566 [Morchella snyderi]|nr:hypothetical protein DFP73DRAFT_560566 [Morchella snyderi]